MAVVSALGSSLTQAPWGWTIAAVVGIALIKAWPGLGKLALDGKRLTLADMAAKRRETRDELSNCQTRLDEMNLRLDEIFARSHDFEMKLVGTIAAYKILDAHVESHDPNALALKQSRSVMSTTFEASPSTNGASRSQPVYEIRRQ